MIKVLGAVLLVGGATFIGISASDGVRARARTLLGFLTALGIMRREIGERLSPLNEVMKRIADVSEPAVSDFFMKCFEEMERRRDIPFALIWSKNLAHSEKLHLGAVEKEDLLALGNVLGRYSAEEQKRSIEHTARRISSALAEAESDVSRLAKLYAKLGVTCGIAVVIVFV